MEDTAKQGTGGKYQAGRKKTGLIILFAALGLVLIAFCAGIYYMYLYGGIYPGVTIDGQDLGGQSRDQALEQLSRSYASRPLTGQMRIAISVYHVDIDLQEVGAHYDAKESVQAAYQYGRTGGFTKRVGEIWRAHTKGYEIESAISVDRTALRGAVADDLAAIERELSDPSYTLEDGKIVVDRGELGVSVDETEFLTFVETKLLAGDFADSEYAPEIDQPDALNLEEIRAQIDQEPQNPTLDLESDPTGNTIIPAREGIKLNLEQAKRILDGTDERIVELPVTVTQPTMTTEEYKALLFRDVLGEKTTSFNASLVGRTTNVKLATSSIDGIILLPGDVFSYNDAVGPRTAARGYKEAKIYIDGNVEDGLGGGICQVSSTVYSANLRADLEIVERHNHRFTVGYVPLGEDATVAWGALDYKFRNNTDYPIKISASCGKNTLTVKILGTQVTPNKEVKLKTNTLSSTPFQEVREVDPTLPVGTTKVKNGGYTGYKTETYRVVYVDGKEVSRKLENRSTYTKLDKVILENPPAEQTGGTPPATDPVTPPVTDPTTPTDPVTPPVTDPTTPTDPVTPPPTDPTAPPDGMGVPTDPPAEPPADVPPDAGTFVTPPANTDTQSQPEDPPPAD